jgi:MFS transporter, FHS family, glucose/mannose:H+ symporter
MISGAPQNKINEKIVPFTTSGTVLLHVDFLLTGIVMTFLGPMLPILSARGYRMTLMIGLLLMSLGMSLLAFGPYWAGILSVGVLGFGYGITTPAGNLRTAEIDPVRSASALNVINAVWGIGAMSSPFLLAIADRAHHPAWFLYSTSAALLALFAVLAFSRFVPDSRAPAVTTSSGSARRLYGSRVLPLICALFFVYVGTETSFGAWIATYAHRLSPAERTFWAVVPSFYWGALLLGRAIAPFILRFKRPTSVALSGLSVAVLGGAALVSAHNVFVVVVGALLAGLGLASIFPISVSLMPAWFGDSTRRASGPVFSSGNMGGAVVPWLVGLVSTRSGNLRLGFFVPLLGVAAMLIFYGVENSTISKRSELRNVTG